MIKPIFASLAAAVLLVPALHAQQPIQLKVGDVDVSDPVFEAQKTPSFQAGDVKNKNVPNPREWLEIEVPFEIKGPRNAVVKDLLFRYYVAFRDQAGMTRTVTGDIKHVNLLTNEKSFSCAYVAPSLLGDITGDFRRFQASSVLGVGVEVFYNGVIVGGKSTAGGKFWEQTGTQPGVLGKAETPFALLWIDRYAEVAPANR